MVHVERVATGYRFTEGPAFSPDGQLLFADVPNRRTYRLAPGQPPAVAREDSGGAAGHGFDAHGRLYTAESAARRVTRIDAKGKLEVLASQWDGKPLNGPNDITVRNDGHVYFTDPAFGSADEQKALPFYGVFHISPRGELSVVARLGMRLNGITLAPNGRLLYVTGSDERNVRVWDIDRAGNASGERVLLTGLPGVPGGVRTDAKGNLWIACKGIAEYAPDGRKLGYWEVPETPSNLVFSPDGKSLYVTARTSVYSLSFEAAGEDRP
jgi:gluconolactonase